MPLRARLAPSLLALALLPVGSAAQTESTPRRLGPPVASYDGDFSAVSGARELRDGRVLVTDFREPALYVVDLRRGTVTKLGRTGSGPNEYRQPGGIYAGLGDTSLVLDRGQPRVLVVSPAGEIVGMRSIELRGTSSSSDEDVDRQRVDSRGFAYFNGQNSALALARTGRQDSTPVLKLDVARQVLDTIARLRPQEMRILSAEGNTIISRTVLFSPADGWGVAPDGRIAVVRAAPYRVEWIGGDGRVVQGPSQAFAAVPVTQADRDAVEAQSAGTSGVARLGSSVTTTAQVKGRLFAESKPPFSPDEIIVAPDGRVFVGRSLPANANRTVYDIFDSRGMRTDRIELPARSRIIGFGPSSIYVSERDADDLPTLRKYAM